MDDKEMLNQIRDHLRSLADAAGENTAFWWTVNGYANIIGKALARIRSHEARAQRVYGEAAPKFSECVQCDRGRRCA